MFSKTRKSRTPFGVGMWLVVYIVFRYILLTAYTEANSDLSSAVLDVYTLGKVSVLGVRSGRSFSIVLIQEEGRGAMRLCVLLIHVSGITPVFVARSWYILQVTCQDSRQRELQLG